MTKLITTTVKRGSLKGDSHGAAYIIDLEARDVRLALDWKKADIDWRARGWDRGLRGVAIDGDVVYITTSDELLAFTPDFELIDSWQNPYLKHAHEISIFDRTLYVVSTAYDSILGFNLDERRFFWALHVDIDRFNFNGSTFDPNGDDGPMLLNKLQLNSITTNDNGMYIAGRESGGLLHFNGDTIYMLITLPDGTNNAQPFRDGAVFNDSEAHALRYVSRSGTEDRAIKIPRSDKEQLEKANLPNEQIARLGYARGLLPVNDRLVAAGYAPATVLLHDMQESETVLSVQVSTDVRDTIHNIAIWPF